MIQDLSLQTDFQSIRLLKSDFHKLNQLVNLKDKTFEVIICSKSFFFSKEQIILFSVDAYIQILKTQMPFCINSFGRFSDDQLISCFSEIFDLFSIFDEILINPSNALIFRFLASQLNNSILFNICQHVIKTFRVQTFFLTSEVLSFIPIYILNSFSNLIINLGTETIECNFIFASLISNKIYRHFSGSSTSNMIDFSNFKFPEMITLFFWNFKWKCL
jgi:hypothetical protein